MSQSHRDRDNWNFHHGYDNRIVDRSRIWLQDYLDPPPAIVRRMLNRQRRRQAQQSLMKGQDAKRERHTDGFFTWW